jgi:hypothetical protein
MSNRTAQIQGEINRTEFYSPRQKELAIKFLLDGWVNANRPSMSPADAALEVLDHAEVTLDEEWEQAQWEAHCREQLGL